MNFRKLNAWRKDPKFTNFSFTDMFPGLGTAAVLFSGYLVVGSVFKKPHHDSNHGDSHGSLHTDGGHGGEKH